jgi:hypothetical protein
MFKYGGDVKRQGIMHGMNGLRDGGIATTMADATGYAGGGMANNQGPRRAALVGNPAYPVGPDGRTGHVAPILIGAGMGLRALAPLAMRYAAKPFGNFVRRQFMGPNTATVGGRKLLGKSPAGYSKEMFQMRPFFANDPLVKAGMAGSGYIGKGLKFAGKLAKGAVTTPTGLALTGASLTDIFPGGKPFGPDKYVANLFGQRFDEDGNKVEGSFFGKLKPKALTKTATGDRGSLLKTDSAPKELTTAEKETKDKERLSKIYKLLGVDKAQRNAASKALVDVSRYIDEGGKDTVSKKNIGSTISKAISSFDKRLDKADQLKEAAGVMMAKSYLDGGDKAQDREYKQVMIDAKKKEMNPDLSDLKAMYTKSGVTDAAGAAASKKFGSAYGGPLMSTKDFNKQLKAFEGQQLEEQTILDIASNAVNNLELAGEGGVVSDGYYKVGENIVLIKEGKAVELVG